jgi:predicted PurR-regulated permease PerM
LIALIALFFSQTRDVNSYFILCIAVFYFGRWAYQRLIKKTNITIFGLVLSFVLLLIFVMQFIGSQSGERWLNPFINVFYERIRLDRQTMDDWAKEGLPIDGGKESRIRAFTREEFLRYLDTDEGEDIQEFLKDNG